jgi:hypothetical protein
MGVCGALLQVSEHLALSYFGNYYVVETARSQLCVKVKPICLNPQGVWGEGGGGRENYSASHVFPKKMRNLMCRGASATVPEEEFIAPFSIPTSIPRFYFAFRKPIQLKREDLKTEGRCDELYNQVKLPSSRRKRLSRVLLCDAWSSCFQEGYLNQVIV